MDNDYFHNKLKNLEKSLLSEIKISEQIGVKDTVQLDQQSTGRLSRVDALQTQQMALAQQRRRENQLAETRLALKRVTENDYGYCIECGEEISPKRLDVNPCVVKCINCAK